MNIQIKRSVLTRYLILKFSTVNFVPLLFQAYIQLKFFFLQYCILSSSMWHSRSLPLNQLVEPDISNYTNVHYREPHKTATSEDDIRKVILTIDAVYKQMLILHVALNPTAQLLFLMLFELLIVKQS